MVLHIVVLLYMHVSLRTSHAVGGPGAALGQTRVAAGTKSHVLPKSLPLLLWPRFYFFAAWPLLYYILELVLRYTFTLVEVRCS
jgi:hypothetical protein